MMLNNDQRIWLHRG